MLGELPALGTFYRSYAWVSPGHEVGAQRHRSEKGEREEEVETAI